VFKKGKKKGGWLQEYNAGSELVLSTMYASLYITISPLVKLMYTNKKVRKINKKILKIKMKTIVEIQ
jgi:hypothetical protein